MPYVGTSNLEKVVIALREGFVPLVPYPGDKQPWLMRHALCGRTVTPRAGRFTCKKCAGHLEDSELIAELGKYGFTALESYPGSIAPWRVRHTECGQEVIIKMSKIREGHGCGYCSGHQIPEDEAIATLASRYLTPLEPFSGHATYPWRVRHLCGKKQTVRLSSLRHKNAKGPCKACVSIIKKPEYQAEFPHLRIIGDWTSTQSPVLTLCSRCGTQASYKWNSIQTTKKKNPTHEPCRTCRGGLRVQRKGLSQ